MGHFAFPLTFIKAPFALPLYQDLVLSGFFLKKLSHLNKWFVVSHCDFIFTNDMEHLVKGLFATNISSLMKYLLKYFDIFLTLVSCFLIVVF